MRGIVAVATKELRQIRRDRRSLLILLFIPVFFLFLFGYALNFDIRHVELAVQDRDRSVESRAVVAAFTRSAYFDQVATVDRESEIAGLMDRGTIRMVLVIPEGFSRQIGRGETADLQVLLNGDNANTATTVMGYVERRADRGVGPAGFAGPRPDGGRGGARLVQPGAAQRAVSRARPDRLHRDDYGRGLHRALHRARDRRTAPSSRFAWRRSRRLSYIIGKTLPYLVIAQTSAFFIILAAMGMFGLPMRGDWLSPLRGRRGLPGDGARHRPAGVDGRRHAAVRAAGCRCCWRSCPCSCCPVSSFRLPACRRSCST